jgi:hypothetical protein
MNQEKKMSAKSLLTKINKATQNGTALGFFDQYREYMVSGELAPILSPIVAKVDAGTLMPTSAMDQLGNIVLTHILAASIVRGEMAAEARANGSKQDNWTATIYNAEDEIQTYINAKGKEVELQQSFIVSGDGDRWADRFLTIDTSGSDWFAIIQHNHSDVKTIVLRADAMARVFRNKKSPVCKPPKVSTHSLSFGVKAKQSRASFSKG